MRFRRSLNRQEGFTLAEVLVAGLIMVVALIPVIRMFDTSVQGMLLSAKNQGAANCARTALEQVCSLPFYEPYKGTNKDIDDFFWDVEGGTRGISNPAIAGDDPGTPEVEYPGPDWRRIPKVPYKAYGAFSGYPNYRADVQIAYLDSDTGVSTMFPEWGPKKPGKDRPRNANNDLVHLLLVRVTVYWMTSDGEKSYSLEQVVTDTATTYNVGVSRIRVTGPASVINDPKLPNSAAHYPNVDTEVEIEGFGFKLGGGLNKADGLNVYLVRPQYNDVRITLVEYDPSKPADDPERYIGTKPDGTKVLKGKVNLYNPYGTGARMAIGYWSVKLSQESIINAYLFNGFIVQYPKPRVTDFGNDAYWSDPTRKYVGYNDQSAVKLRIYGDTFITAVKNPTPVLICYAEDGETVLDQAVGTVSGVYLASGYPTTKTTDANKGYSPNPASRTPLVMEATFDLTKVRAGLYEMAVYNTDPGNVIGHVMSDRLTSVRYEVKDVPPEVTAVYASRTTDSRVYNNAGNPWNLEVRGRYFNTVVYGSYGYTEPLEVYLCSQVVDGEPAGDWVKGTEVNVISSTLFFASFDLSALPAGNYKVFVRNLKYDQSVPEPIPNPKGWSDGAPLAVYPFSGGLAAFAPDPGNQFYENYYDIPSKINGSGFSQMTRVSIYSDSGGITEYDITGESTRNSDTQITVNLNLLECSSARSWRLRVYYYGGYYLELPFTVSLGPAKILTFEKARSQGVNAVWIYRERGSTNNYSYETYGSGSPVPVTYARALDTSNRTGYATFYVRGMGFPLSGNGRTRLTIYSGNYPGHTVIKTGDYDIYQINRDTKTLIIRSDRWDMPSTSSAVNRGMMVQRVVGTSPQGTPDYYDVRWVLAES